MSPRNRNWNARPTGGPENREDVERRGRLDPTRDRRVRQAPPLLDGMSESDFFGEGAYRLKTLPLTGRLDPGLDPCAESGSGPRWGASGLPKSVAIDREESAFGVRFEEKVNELSRSGRRPTEADAEEVLQSADDPDATADSVRAVRDRLERVDDADASVADVTATNVVRERLVPWGRAVALPLRSDRSDSGPFPVRGVPLEEVSAAPLDGYQEDVGRRVVESADACTGEKLGYDPAAGTREAAAVGEGVLHENGLPDLLYGDADGGVNFFAEAKAIKPEGRYDDPPARRYEDRLGAEQEEWARAFDCFPVYLVRVFPSQ